MQDQVYELVKQIPYGKVATYSQIAEKLGNKNLARAVGNALHHNPDPDETPCFKVVNVKGELSCHFAFGGAAEQKKRLEKEGITVIDNKVDLTLYGWCQ